VPNARQRLRRIIAALAIAMGFSAPGQSVATPNADGPATYEALRSMALSVKPGDIGITPPAKGVYGVVMDLDIDGSTATVVSFSSGDASIYLSTGGGMIGGRSHKEVAAAANRFVDAAQAQLGLLKRTRTFPRPGPGRVIFYVLTATGVLTADGDESTLAESREPLSPLFIAGQDVITRLRQTHPK